MQKLLKLRSRRFLTALLIGTGTILSAPIYSSLFSANPEAFYNPILDSSSALDEWCGSNDAESLRERNESNQINIHDLLTRGSADRVVLFAHRGGYTCEEVFSAPENSIANVKKAIQFGFEGYEADVWPTKDGNFVVHHDLTLERTTTGTGRVIDYTLEELRELSLKFESGLLSHEKIPSLQELLQAGDQKILFLLQIKYNVAENFPQILEIVKKTDSQKNSLFWVKATKENVDAFEAFIKSGMEDIHSSVVWRVINLEQLEEVSARIKPRFVDFPLTVPDEWSEETYDQLFPYDHLSLVEEGLNYPFTPMVSRIRTNKYMDTLYQKGIRVFATKKAEVQLSHTIKNGSHP